MKRILSIILITTFFLGAELNFPDDQKEVNWNSFNKGLEQSKAANKKMVVSVYTDWCSWCKKMEGQTYKDKNVVEYLKKNYVAVKLNAESKNKVKFQNKDFTEQSLSQGFGITGYPATIFLDEKQDPITIVPGYISADQFVDILKFIGDNVYKSKTFEEYLKTKK